MGRTVIKFSCYGVFILLAGVILFGCGKPVPVNAQYGSAHAKPTATPTPQPTPGTGKNLCVPHPADGKAPPLVSLDAYSFHPQHDVGFYGHNFQPGEDVNVLLGNPKSTADSKDNQNLTTAHANNGGDVTGRVHITMLTPGSYFLYFVGQQCTVSVGVMLLPFAPWVVLDNYAPYPHYSLGFRGQGFAPNEPVSVYLNAQNTNPVAQVQADTSGQFAVNQAWNVGDLTGDNTLLFVGTYTKMVVSVNFEVQEPQATPPGGTFHAQAASPRGVAWAPRLSIRHDPTPSPIPTSSSDGASNDLPFLSLDPVVFVLGFLMLWFVLCIVLASAISIERFPRLAFLKWPAKQPPEMSRIKTEDDVAAEPTRWLKTTQRGLPTPGIQVSSRTERGQIHTDHIKEDHFLAITGIRRAKGQPQPFALLVVADSVGHYADGLSAGRRTLHTIFQALAPCLTQEDLPNEDLSTRLEEALQGANRLLYWQNQREIASSSCSVTAALVSCQQATICNVGNSRAYMLPGQTPLRRVTTDHSIVERCVTAGLLQRDDKFIHLKRSRLYRSLGQHPDVQVDTFRLPVAAGDQLLLCSNGLWEILAEAELEAMLREAADATSASHSLVEQAKARSSLDNMTALIIRFVEASSSSQQPGIDHVASGSSHPSSRQPIF